MDKDFMNYFIERTDERFDKLETKNEHRFDKLETKLDILLKFKWQIVGGSVLFSSLVAFAVQLFLNSRGV